MKKILMPLLLTVLLTGCTVLAKSPIGQLTLADAQTASTMAKAANDTPAQKCYDYIISMIQGAGASGTCGLLCLNETKRSSITTSNNLGAACGGVLPLDIAL